MDTITRAVIALVLLCGGPFCQFIPWMQRGEEAGQPGEQRDVATKYILDFCNSFQGYGLTWALLAEYADAAGYDKPVVRGASIGGADLDVHIAAVATSPGDNVQHSSLPVGETWDYVIVQGDSQEATEAVNSYSAFAADALQLAQDVRDHASGNGAGAKILLFRTWPYNNKNAVYPATWADEAAMLADINGGYAAAETAINAAYGADTATSARVGDAFAAAGYIDALYYSYDWYHPGRLAPALSAMVLYKAIYGGDCADVSYAAATAAGFITHTITGQGPITLTEAEYEDLQTWVDSLDPANVAPTAQLTATPIGGDAPLTVNFSAAGSSDSDGSLVSRSLNYGDGSAVSSLTTPFTASHSYAAAGVFTATLTVTDNEGATDSDSVTITVTEASGGGGETEPGDTYLTPLPLSPAEYDQYESGHGVLIDVEDAAGVVQGSGPIYTATAWNYTDRLNQAGEFGFTMPAADSRAALLKHHRNVRAHALLFGHWHQVGAGVIESIERDAQNVTMLRVSGGNLLRELAYVPTPGLELLEHVESGVTVKVANVTQTLPATFTLAGYKDSPAAFINFDSNPDHSFDRITLTFGASKNTTVGTFHWQYSADDDPDLDWVELSVEDTTIVAGAPFAQSGTVEFKPPGNWGSNYGFVVRCWFENEDETGMTSTTLNSVTLHHIEPLATPLATLATYLPAGWSIVDLNGDPVETTRAINLPEAGDNLLAALVNVAEAAGDSFRLASTGRVIEWLGVTYPHAGVYAVGPAEPLRAHLYPHVCQIVDIAQATDSHDLCSYVYAFGGGEGEGRVTLEQATATRTGYTLTEDARGYWYVERTGASTYIGRAIGRTIEETRIVPADASPEAAVDAANQLFEWTCDWLAMNSATADAELPTAYSGTLAGLHQPLQSGSQVGVQYNEWVDGYRALGINEDLILLEAQTQFQAGGVETTGVTLASDPPRWPTTDAGIVVRSIGKERTNRTVAKPEAGYSNTGRGVLVSATIKNGAVVGTSKIKGETDNVNTSEAWRLRYIDGVYVGKEDLS